MSLHTILRFNHDHSHRIREKPEEFLALLEQVLNSGVNCNPDNEHGNELEGKLRRFGVTVSPTHHHSDQAELSLKTEHGLEYWKQSF